MKRPLTLSHLAWKGCKITNALALWIALFTRQYWLVAIPLVTHGVSVLFGPRHAPQLVLYDWLNRWVKTKKIVVDARALRFAHGVGSTFALLALALSYSFELWGRAIILILAVMITLGSLGICTATKLYDCMSEGCCVLKR